MVPWTKTTAFGVAFGVFFLISFWEDTGQKTKIPERPSLKFISAAADDDVDDDDDGDCDDDEGDSVLLPP